MLVRTAADETAASIAATEELTASVDLASDQLDAHGLMLTARATSDAEAALDGAAQAIAAARGKSDAAELEASVAALSVYDLLAPERIFELADLAEAQAATVRAEVAEFDRIAAEKAAAEKAAAERAEAERVAAERAAAEQADQSVAGARAVGRRIRIDACPAGEPERGPGDRARPDGGPVRLGPGPVRMPRGPLELRVGLERVRQQSERRVRDSAGASRLEDGVGRSRLGDECTYPDHLGPGLHRRPLQHPVRCVGACRGQRLVLAESGVRRNRFG